MTDLLLPAPLQPVSLEHIAHHLKLTLTPSEHERLLDQYRTPSGVHYRPYQAVGEEDDPNVRAYWSALPEYLIARCPVCGAADFERMDTHCLENGWLINSGASIFGGEYKRDGCEHRVAAQGFIHLNGVIPLELKYYSGQSEVPYVMPIFLPDEPQSYTVMHSVPICRSEEGKFAPRYTLFMLTYYSKAPEILLRRRAQDAERGKNDPDFRLPLMYPWFEAIFFREAWNLPLWVARGKLWWLDLDRDDLPLKSGPVSAFPYGNVRGRRYGFIYRAGELILQDYGFRVRIERGEFG